MTQSEDIKSRIIKQNPSIQVIDSTGRVITIRKPKGWVEYEFVRILGHDATPGYTTMCIPLLWVESIDGNITPPIDKKSQILPLLKLLDDHGIKAINAAVVENMELETDEEVIGEIKK